MYNSLRLFPLLVINDFLERLRLLSIGAKYAVRNIVLELPPAPAALVLVGLAFLILSPLPTAAFLLTAVLGAG